MTSLQKLESLTIASGSGSRVKFQLNSITVPALKRFHIVSKENAVDLIELMKRHVEIEVLRINPGICCSEYYSESFMEVVRYALENLKNLSSLTIQAKLINESSLISLIHKHAKSGFLFKNSWINPSCYKMKQLVLMKRYDNEVVQKVCDRWQLIQI